MHETAALLIRPALDLHSFDLLFLVGAGLAVGSLAESGKALSRLRRRQFGTGATAAGTE